MVDLFNFTKTLLQKFGSRKTTKIAINDVRNYLTSKGIADEKQQDEFMEGLFKVMGVM